MKKYLAAVVGGNDLRLLAASLATGVIVAVIVAMFEALTQPVLFEWLLEQSLATIMIAQLVGLVAAQLILRFLGRGTTAATSAVYIRVFHDRPPRPRQGGMLRRRPVRRDPGGAQDHCRRGRPSQHMVPQRPAV